MKRWARVLPLFFLGAALTASARIPLPAQSLEAPPPAYARLEQKYASQLAAFEEMVPRQMAADRTTGLAIGRLEGATALLRIATELHPKVANLYDSLGELELKAGHTDAAVAAYEKALEIDPKMESSIQALEAIRKRKP